MNLTTSCPVLHSPMHPPPNPLSWSPAMEPLLSAIMSDLLGRALSVLIQRYRPSKAEETEHKLQRLRRVLLRVDATVEEAEGRHITNQAMLRQLDMLRQGMYAGHYVLDTFRYKGRGEVSGGRDVVLSRLSSAKRRLSFPVSSSSKEKLQNTVLDDAENLKNLEKVLDGLETLMGDMVEFAVFLEGYPRIARQPNSEYLVLDKVMFGRQMEKEAIIDFLLRPEAAGDGNPGVLPIVGAAWIGKSTLVEHVCLDERVRGHFSSIVFFGGDDLGAENMAALGQSGVMKHQDLTAASRGRSLVVIELTGDMEMEEETWRNLCCSAERSMGRGGKIIITSRSEKIAALGTAPALRLKFLPQEAYWYFFKILAFGSTNPDDQPELASLAMEIAALLDDGSFLGANIVGSLMRTNLNVQFWRRVLQCVRDFTSKNLLTYGKHPKDHLEKGYPGYPTYACSIGRSQNEVVIYNIYQVQERTTEQGLPELTAHDIMAGRATHQGKFRAVGWRSSIPPYYTYMFSCASQTAGCSTVRKKRPRQMMV